MKRGRYVVWGLASVLTAHLVLHLSFFGMNLGGVGFNGVSAYAVIKGSSLDILESDNLKNDSGILIVSEGVLLVGSLVVRKVRFKKGNKSKEIVEISSKKGEYNTEIDRFYSIIEDNSPVSLESIAKKMDVSIDLVEKWSDILEKEGILNIEKNLFGKTLVKSVN